jgi:Tfp pilus assembly protein PilV
MNPTLARPFPARQRGVSLLEALIAFLLLSIGMLALTRLQNDLRANADAARERSEAVRLAQLDIEGLRAFADRAAWSAIADASADVTPAGSTTRYTLERVVGTSAEPGLKAVQVTLHWNDRHGTVQQLQLATLIAGHDPALSAALALPRPPLPHP